MDEKFLARFWAKVNKDGPVHPILGTKCWDWVGSRHPRGYGHVGTRRITGGKRFVDSSHRVSLWIQAGEPVPDGVHVRHKCDRTCCVNPEHLETGTHQDNMRDRAARLRGSRKLDPEKVREIRRLISAGHTHEVIGAKFGITGSIVSNIRTGKTWRHVG